MSLSHSRLAPFLLAVTFAAMWPAAAQVPNTLLHSLFDPSPGTIPQAQAAQGFSVAVDGNIAVAGAPYDDTGAPDSGVVKVYDTTTGALLHKLANPSPEFNEQFGRAVAISGARVVIGAYQDNTGASDAGIAYVYDLASVTPTVPVTTLTNPSPAASDYFGRAVAISGTRVVIGAYWDDTGGYNTGSAYVYDLTNATPTAPLFTLTNPRQKEGDYFGTSVAISGTRVVVGAIYDDTGTNDAGIAYVFELSSTTPTVSVATLTNPSPASYDVFGSSVTVSGTRVVIGAYQDNTGASDAGIAYVYDLASVTPTVPVITLTNPSPAASDQFGYSVSVSGLRVVVGVSRADTGATDTGIAYVYDLASAIPTVPVTTLSNPTPAMGDGFGSAVGISDTTVVIGTPYDDTLGTNTGSAYIYDLASATPNVPTATVNNPSPTTGSYFGSSVAVSGTRVVVGTPFDVTGAAAAGSAYVYDLAAASPTVPAVTLTNPSPAAYDYFGGSVAISGMLVVVGTSEHNAEANDSGIAYVFDLASATPTVPLVTLNNPSPGMQDHFGSSVAISGTRVVVGAYLSYPAGSAYVYDLASATPTVPVTTLNNPSPAVFDQFGYSVGISATRVVVGEPSYYDAGAGPGSAHVYDLASATPTVPVATLTNPSPAVADGFGRSVAISGTRVVIGTPFDYTSASEAGIAYAYDLASATPTVPTITLTNPSPAENDRFGSSAAISGSRVVVGVRLDDTGAPNAGIAYVFDLTSATPTVPVATLSNPTPVRGDVFGSSVGVDGTTVVAGAPYDDTIAADPGAAYVFGLSPALNIVPAAPGFATISWTPATSSGFVLQCTDSFTPTNWVAAPSGAANPATISATNVSRFYRLLQP